MSAVCSTSNVTSRIRSRRTSVETAPSPRKRRQQHGGTAPVPANGKVSPASRCSWSGLLQLGPLSVPVKGYSAAVTQRDGLLHQIHTGCGCRIQQIKNCPQHGSLSADQIAKAFEVSPGEQVVLSENDLARLQPLDDQTIHIEHLLPESRMDWSLLSGRSLFLVPTHSLAGSLYVQAVTVLAQAEEWGIGHVVLSETRYLVGVHAVNGVLLLHVLHWPAQWRACPVERIPRETVPEVLSNSLLAALAPLRKPFDWHRQRDDAELRLTKLLAEKAAEQAIRVTTNSPRSEKLSSRSAVRAA